MTSGSLSRRYARALLELGKEEGRVEKLGEALERFARLLAIVPGALETLSNRSFPPAERLRVVEQISEKAKVDASLRNFFCLLVKKERMALLPEITREYRSLSDEFLGVIRVKVFAPESPDPEMLAGIEKLLHQKLRKKIIAKGISDPSLLGGILLDVGPRRFDGSVRRHLERIRENLINSSLKQ